VVEWGNSSVAGRQWRTWACSSPIDSSCGSTSRDSIQIVAGSTSSIVAFDGSSLDRALAVAVGRIALVVEHTAWVVGLVERMG